MGKEESEKPQYRKYVVFFLSLIGLLAFLGFLPLIYPDAILLEPSVVLPLTLILLYAIVLRGEYN